MYVRKLAKVGVRIASVTQELGDDPAQIMMRQIIAMFDEYQSRENAKHVLRAMKENARQGFYNGSPLPLGYTVEEFEKRGARIKKKLVVDPVEAETVKLIFNLYTLGDGKSGPIGVKAIACWLNERGHRSRTGGRFGTGTVHKILTNPVYAGTWVFNKMGIPFTPAGLGDTIKRWRMSGAPSQESITPGRSRKWTNGFVAMPVAGSTSSGCVGRKGSSARNAVWEESRG
jgi:hypothetical protein